MEAAIILQTSTVEASVCALKKWGRTSASPGMKSESEEGV